MAPILPGCGFSSAGALPGAELARVQKNHHGNLNSGESRDGKRLTALPPRVGTVSSLTGSSGSGRHDAAAADMLLISKHGLS